MNREIKFKAWDNGYFKPLEDDGDYYFQDYGDGLKLFNKFGECENVVLLQFTGLKDKNGKEVYEGDILSLFEYKMKVEWVDYRGAFNLKEIDNPIYNDEYMINNARWGEIIGNIFENPELLKP